jgi:serine/threonine protein kinase
MHNKGYVYRDLKPENISFEKENDYRSLKLTSFLTVKKKREGDKMSGINGSVRYFWVFIFYILVSLYGPRNDYGRLV